MKRKYENTEQFIEEAEKVHEKKYDYSLSSYKNGNTKIKIICPIHGIFEQRPSDHMRGQGCPKCGLRKANNNRRFTKEQFIEAAEKVHGKKYDYSMVDYKNSSTKVKIVCPIHGIFEQRPSDHIRGQGCPKCGRKKSDSARICSKEDFIEKAKEIYGEKYIYDVSNYENRRTKVTIKCMTCGRVFKMAAYAHLAGEECICFSSSKSSQEKELVEYLRSIYSGSIIENDRKILNGKEIDIYIPEKKIAFEYDGCHWHNDTNNYFKYEECKKQGIRLYHIIESTWLLKKEIVKSVIDRMFNKSIIIDGSSCLLKEISDSEYEAFCESNTIEGKQKADVKIGLFFKEELVYSVGFLKNENNEWNVSRESTKNGYAVMNNNVFL